MSRSRAIANPAAWSFLLDGLVPLDIAELRLFWRRTGLRITCEAPRRLEAGPWLPGFLRGAWGRALLRAAHSGTRELNGLCARDVFFAAPGAILDGHEPPKPFVISADHSGDTLIVELTLFGRAEAWRQQAFDAMIEAVEGGISMRAGGGQPREGLAIRDVAWWRTETVAVPLLRDSARLFFVTPVRFGSVAELLLSMQRRVAGLARWQGFVADFPDSFAAVPEFDDSGLFHEPWLRRSSAQRARRIPMFGRRGPLVLMQPSEQLWPLLALAETCYCGKNPGFGLGRFVLS